MLNNNSVDIIRCIFHTNASLFGFYEGDNYIKTAVFGLKDLISGEISEEVA